MRVQTKTFVGGMAIFLKQLYFIWPGFKDNEYASVICINVCFQQIEWFCTTSLRVVADLHVDFCQKNGYSRKPVRAFITNKK